MSSILIVEDEFPIALDLETRVKKLGHQVVAIASNFETAIMDLEKHQPDLVLLDINLGRSKSGIDVAREINQMGWRPFIFITAYSDDFTFRQCLDTNPSGFLIKPVNDKLLFHQIELALKSSSYGQLQSLKEKLDQNQSKLEACENLPNGWEELSAREKEVILLLSEGYSDKELAEQLFVSVNTVRTHLRRSYDKLLIGSRLEAVALLTKHGLV